MSGNNTTMIFGAIVAILSWVRNRANATPLALNALLVAHGTDCHVTRVDCGNRLSGIGLVRTRYPQLARTSLASVGSTSTTSLEESGIHTAGCSEASLCGAVHYRCHHSTIQSEVLAGDFHSSGIARSTFHRPRDALCPPNRSAMPT